MVQQLLWSNEKLENYTIMQYHIMRYFTFTTQFNNRIVIIQLGTYYTCSIGVCVTWLVKGPAPERVSVTNEPPLLIILLLSRRCDLYACQFKADVPGCHAVQDSRLQPLSCLVILSSVAARQ